MKRASIQILLVILSQLLLFPSALNCQRDNLQLSEDEKIWISSHSVLNVANELDWPPFDFAENGMPMGYSIDLMKLISKKTGLQIKFVNGYTWAELMQMFREGELDILPAFYLNEDRKKFMAYTSSYASNQVVLATHAGNSSISTIDHLNGKIVALIRGYVNAEAIENRYPKINRIYVKDALEGLTKVSLGEADAFLGSIGTVSYITEKNFIPNIKVVGSISLKTTDETELHIGVLKERKILHNILQKGLDAVSATEFNALRQRWMPISTKKEATSQTATLLTPEELQWISDHAPMKVANEMDLPPFNFTENGTAKGYSIDLIQLIGEKTGLPLQFENGYTWSEIVEKFKIGELDILPYLYFTEDRNEFISFTESYEANPAVLVVNVRNTNVKSLEDLSFKQVAVVGGSTAEILENKHPNIELISVKNPIEGLNAVSAGSVDGFIASLGTISFLISKNFIPNIKIVGDIHLKNEEESKIHFGVAKDRIILRDILQKGLDAISADEFSSIRQKWMPVSIDSDKESGNFKSSELWKIIILIFFGFIAMTIGVRYIIRNFIKEQISLEFGSQRFRTMAMLSMLFIVLIITLLGWWATQHNKTKILGDLEINLETTLANTHERLLIWVDQKKSFLQQLGRDPVLVQATQELLKVSTDNSALLSSDALNKVRLFYEKHQNQLQSVGFFIISKEYLNLASSRDENIGVSSFIYKQKPGLINQVFKGNPVFIPPMESDVVLDESQNNDSLSKPPTMFFGTPIQSASGEVLAALAIRVEPAAGFSRVMQLARVGETGESYAFNQEGRLLSESRFDDDLRKIDLISKNQQGILQIEIRDPGGNMVTGYRSNTPRHQQPLTHMANSATNGETGIDMSGYRDYRGVPVYGSWLWDPDLGLGMATEIDVEEGRSTYNTMVLTVVGVIGVAILLMVFAIMFTLILGERANKALVKAKNELEEKVVERTDELFAANQQIQGIVDSLADALIIINEDGIIESFSPSSEKMFLYEEKEIRGLNISNLMTSPHSDDHNTYLKRYKNTGEAKIIGKEREVNGLRKDGSIFPARLMVSEVRTEKKRLFVGLMSDLTDRKKSEEQLKIQAAAMESAANGIVITDTSGLIQWVNPAFSKLTGYSPNEVIGKNPRILNSGSHDKSFFSEIWDTLLAGKVWYGEIINKKKNGELYYEEMTITPVFDDDSKISQYVAIKQDISERKRMEDALEKANTRMKSELNVAKDIQMSMLPLIFPAFPMRKEIDVYASLIPAREVGGDFYDFYFIDENHFCITIGDVSGKGVPAALLMAVTKTMLKARSDNEFSTASILTHVNNEISKENDNYMFITVFMGILNTTNGDLVYTNAGHNPSYIKKSDGEMLKLTDLHGPVVGAMEGFAYKESRINVNFEDLIFLYTDGVTEAQDFQEELFSDNRLSEFLRKNTFENSQEVVKSVIKEVKKHEGKQEQFDDITILGVRFMQNTSEIKTDSVHITIENKQKEITSGLEQFEEFATIHEVPMMIIQRVNIVLDDLLNNTISYAYTDDKIHKIDIFIDLYENKLKVTLKDDGIPFNPFENSSPDTNLSIEEREIGGLGIHLAKNLMDEYEYEYKRSVNMNVVTLVKFGIQNKK